MSGVITIEMPEAMNGWVLCGTFTEGFASALTAPDGDATIRVGILLFGDTPGDPNSTSGFISSSEVRRPISIF